MRQASVWYSSQPLASTLTDGSGVSTCTAPSVWFHCCHTASSAPRASEAPRKRCTRLARLTGIAPDTEPEDDFTPLPVGQIDAHLNRGAGVEAGTHLAGKPCAAQRGRIACRAVATEEFRAVAGDASLLFIHVEECDPVGKLGVVGVARKERAALRVDFGADVHGRFGAQIAEYPFHVAGRRELARTTGFVAQLQHRKFDRGVDCDIDPEFRAIPSTRVSKTL
jgi:hypothetical protein